MKLTVRIEKLPISAVVRVAIKSIPAACVSSDFLKIRLCEGNNLFPDTISDRMTIPEKTPPV